MLTDFHADEAKKLFFETNIQNCRLKKLEFFNSTNYISILFHKNFRDWSLGEWDELMQKASMQHSVSHRIIETQIKVAMPRWLSGLRHHYLAELFWQVPVVVQTLLLTFAQRISNCGILLVLKLTNDWEATSTSAEYVCEQDHFIIMSINRKGCKNVFLHKSNATLEMFWIYCATIQKASKSKSKQ